MKDAAAVLNYKRLWLNVVLIIFSAAASFYTLFIVPLLFLLTTNLFDILGYHFTLIRKTNKLPEKDIVKSYRIIQLMFDVILSLLILLLFGLVPALCGIILKLFALQDLLYYFFLNEKLPANWNWLGFTPLGWFKKSLSRTEVLLQAIIGILISAILLMS